MQFTLREIELLMEALAMAASRHEAQARFRPHIALRHDNAACDMRALRQRFYAVKVGADAANFNAALEKTLAEYDRRGLKKRR